ncbi:MAG: DUF6265 family protein [Maricaulaceae bacterium]
MNLRLLALCGGLWATGVAAAENGADLAWLAGHWRAEADNRISEEIWTQPEGGLMLGLNRTIRNGEAVAFEFLRLEIGSETVLVGQPGGGSGTTFTLVRHDAQSARFENPDHDFPQRIVYARDGATLTATLSDMSGGQVRRFQWRRVAGD